MAALTVAQIAELCGGEIEGDSTRIVSGANALHDARETDVSFVANSNASPAALSSRAGCLIVPSSFEHSGPWSLIRIADPRAAFARVLPALYPKTQPIPQVHPTAVIAASVIIADGCFIAPYVVIGEETRIGKSCFIGAGSSIGNRVVIGDDATIHPNVTIYDGVEIGARVILHSGCVIGADGFGFTLVTDTRKTGAESSAPREEPMSRPPETRASAPFALTGDHYEKFPQIGSVQIGDDVEIGANCCIDRAALGVTRIQDGAKLDNLIHVAHNCTVGKHVVIAAQAGFSGSVAVGDYAVIGGQAGVGEKAKIAARAVVGGKSGILTSQQIHAGEPVWGIPARPLRQHLKGLANVARLAELRNQIRQLKKKIEQLETGRDPN